MPISPQAMYMYTVVHGIFKMPTKTITFLIHYKYTYADQLMQQKRTKLSQITCKRLYFRKQGLIQFYIHCTCSLSFTKPRAS